MFNWFLNVREYWVGQNTGISTWIFWFQIREKCRELIYDNDTLRKIGAIFLDNIKRGLGKATHADSIVKCFPTYVQDIPDGTGKEINFLRIF